MKKIKTYLKYGGFTLLSILIWLLLLSTLYYYNIISNSIINYLRPLVILLNIFISSYILGKNSDKNGYLEGAKFGFLMIFIFLFISLIFFRGYLKPRLVLYDIILLAISIFGSMLGINKEKKNWFISTLLLYS